jgi:hypothetical protein
MEKYFNCFNCKELINIVFESKCCGILYCHNCKSKLINTQCLKCDKPLELQRNMFAQRLLKNINVKCKYGCGTTLTYDKMKEHLLICDKKIYLCSFDNIKNDGKDEKVFKGFKKEMIDHMVKQHPKILLFFMENSKTFQKQIDKILNKNIDKMNDDTILNISNNLNNSLLINDENEENTHIEFEHDMQLLNRINDLNLINSNINNFNDLRINNGTNNNIPSFRINNSYQENNNNNNNNALNNMINSFINSEGNDSIDNNNNIRLLDSNIHRNNLNSLRELSYNSNSNDNVNVNLIYRLNQNNNINNNSNHSDDNS